MRTEGQAWTLSRWINDLKQMLPYLLKLVTHHWDEPFVNLCAQGSAGHGYYREIPQNITPPATKTYVEREICLYSFWDFPCMRVNKSETVERT
jgi:hypothetical protein